MGLILDLSPELGPALVVGGGTVARRKVRGLVATGFRVTVVAPEIRDGIDGELVTLAQRPYEPGDTEGFVVVFACTDVREVNQAVSEEAKAAGKPVVVADRGAEGTATTPAVHRDGDLTVAVTTGGVPRMAGAIRDEIVAALGEGRGAAIEKARAERDG